MAAAAPLTIGASACGIDQDPLRGPSRATRSPQSAAPTAVTSAPAASPSATTSSSGSAPSVSPSPSSASPNSGGSAQTASALHALATAKSEVQGGRVFDLEDDTEAGQRHWDVKVADPDGRQFNLTLSEDGRSVITTKADKTPDDDVAKLRSAKVSPQEAISIAVSRAKGQGNLTSLEIDTDNNNIVVWQVEFGDVDGTTVLVDAASVTCSLSAPMSTDSLVSHGALTRRPR